MKLHFLGFLMFLSAAVGAPSPFTVTPSLTASNGSHLLEVRFGLPAQHHIYAERVSVRWEGEDQALSVNMPEPRLIQDRFSGEQKLAFADSFAAAVVFSRLWETNRNLLVRFQGCDEAQCYFPETHTFAVSPAGRVEDITPPPADSPSNEPPSGNWKALAGGFQVAGRSSGYLNTKTFLGFLDQSLSGTNAAQDSSGGLRRWGWLAMLGLILLGGIGLNFTPCVLPLIPVNLSIIGARGENSNRSRGLRLGAAYGFGMTAAYGLLGVVIVLTGSKFGTVNSSPWFNLVIALVFGVLALGMFDRLSIDFSRFLRRGAGGQSGSGGRGPYLVAVTMGGIAALLAGACVAPVVISVIVLAADFYNRGYWPGLLLPFCLGLGMALPWPALGAGLSLLPKPGAWMTRVKHGFGVIIAVLALYYGHLAFGLFQDVQVSARELGRNPAQDLAAALASAKADGKPVLVDFWASWCKNCSTMEHTTFKDRQVVKRLEDYHVVKFQAEKPDAMPAKEVLDHFGVMGLPTCVVLKPGAALAPDSPSTAPTSLKNSKY